VLGGDAVDHLGDEHRLADARPAEQADLAAGHVRGQQVDDLDAGLEHAGRRLEGVERRGVTVDLPPLHVGEALGLLVEGVAPRVPDVAEDLVADRYTDAVMGVAHRRPTRQAVGRLHADGADATLTELLGDLREDDGLVTLDRDVELERGVDLGERSTRELDVDDRAGDADDAPVRAATARGRCVLRDGHNNPPETAPTSSSSRMRMAGVSPPPAPRASAPETISMISVVIES
jgi:hypothetical protein